MDTLFKCSLSYSKYSATLGAIIKIALNYHCYDLFGGSVNKCSQAVIEARQYVPGDVVFTNIYPETGNISSFVVKKSEYKAKNEVATTIKSAKYFYSMIRPLFHENHRKINGRGLEAPLKKIIDTGSPYLCLYSTSCSENMNRFVDIESKRFNTVVLGLQTEWSGFGQRLLSFRKLLQKLDPNALVIWSDASDVRFLPTCSPSEIEDTFKTFGTPLVFIGEHFCWPDISLKEKFPKPDNPPIDYRFLNAGLSIGRAWAYLDVLNELVSSGALIPSSDDQYLFHLIYLENRHYSDEGGAKKMLPVGETTKNSKKYFSIDWHQRLMMDMQGQPLDTFNTSKFNETGRLIFKPSGGTPCMFHQMGRKTNERIDRIEELFSSVNMKW